MAIAFRALTVRFCPLFIDDIWGMLQLKSVLSLGPPPEQDAVAKEERPLMRHDVLQNAEEEVRVVASCRGTSAGWVRILQRLHVPPSGNSATHMKTAW